MIARQKTEPDEVHDQSMDGAARQVAAPRQFANRELRLVLAEAVEERGGSLERLDVVGWGCGCPATPAPSTAAIELKPITPHGTMAAPGRTMSTNELDLVVTRDVAVPMRDGTLLRADIFRPSNSTESPAPTILVRTTYDKQRAQDTRDAERFARSGYVFVIQDVRGRYTSDGCFYHGVDEADDGRDTIDWMPANHGPTARLA